MPSFSPPPCLGSGTQKKHRKNRVKLLKKPLLQKQRWLCDFSHEKRSLAKSTAPFPAKKRWQSSSPLDCLGTSLCLPQSLYLPMHGRMLTSESKVIASRRLRDFLPKGVPLRVLSVRELHQYSHSSCNVMC